MKEKIIDVDFRTKEQKKHDFKASLNSKINKGKDWIVNNKETIILLGPVTLGCVATITKVVGKRANLKKEESLKNLFCYDRSLGHYWKLKRKLSNKEWIEIDRRKMNGERLADILDELKVLK